MKKIVFSLLAVLLFAVSCKKKDEQASLVGKWNIVSVETKSTSNGQTTTSTQNGTPGDYVDFRNDGKVEVSFMGQTSTNTYQITNNNTQVIIDGDVNEIRTLTSSSAVLYSSIVNGTDKDETTVTLKR